MTYSKIPAGLALCPRCAGYPELDESGRPYTCYFCCDVGYVDAAVARAEELAESDVTEQFRPACKGAFAGPDSIDWEYASDEEIADTTARESKPGHRLFTGLYDIERSIKAAARAACAAAYRAAPAAADFDDIPF